MKRKPTLSSKQKISRLRWLCSSGRKTTEYIILMNWYRTQYKKHLNELGQEIADLLLV